MADYRVILENHIKKNGKWANHPWRHITMQVHHLISKEGFKKSKLNSQIKAKFKNQNYEIDVAQNLVAIPSEYQGACHLQAQLHRGNHPTIKGSSYHEIVAGYIEEDIKDIKTDEVCRDTEEIQKTMNKISKKIMRMIDKSQLPLTFVSEGFETDNPIGCRNVLIGKGKLQYGINASSQDKYIHFCSTTNRVAFREPEERDPRKTTENHYPHVATPHTLKVGN